MLNMLKKNQTFPVVSCCWAALCCATVLLSCSWVEPIWSHLTARRRWPLQAHICEALQKAGCYSLAKFPQSTKNRRPQRKIPKKEPKERPRKPRSLATNAPEPTLMTWRQTVICGPFVFELSVWHRTWDVNWGWGLCILIAAGRWRSLSCLFVVTEIKQG